jgi:hypothetical protein
LEKYGDGESEGKEAKEEEHPKNRLLLRKNAGQWAFNKIRKGKEE